jgi:trimeric autotransporter adhesin
VGRCAGVFALCLAVIGAIGCGGSSSSDTTQQLRIVMASPDATPVDILFDGTQIATSLAFTNSTAYLPVKSGSRHIQALTVSNSTSVFDQTISITASANETLLLTGPVAKMQSLLLIDGATNTTITTGDGKVRVVNASQTMGPADVYIVNAGTSLAGATPTSTALAFGKATDYTLEIIGDFQVVMTQPGTTNVLLNTGPLDLIQSQFKTVVAVDAVGGGFNFIVLTDQ